MKEELISDLEWLRDKWLNGEYVSGVYVADIIRLLVEYVKTDQMKEFYMWFIAEIATIIAAYKKGLENDQNIES